MDRHGCLSGLVMVLLSGMTMSLAGCMAATSKPRAETPAARIPDSVGEKSAAQRSASGPLQLEDEDQRWGIEAAKERKRRSDAAQSRPSGEPTKVPTGPVDIRVP